MKEKGINYKKLLRDVVIVLTSVACGSFAQICVMIPNGMTSGGVPGITRLITHFFPINYSIVYYGISMIILIVEAVAMGFAEVRRIIAMVLTYPVMLYLFQKTGFELLSVSDPFLASVIIGLFYGLATGIGYIGGYSSGGVDSIARVLKYKVFNYVPVGTIQLVMDGTIILLSAFVFNTNVALYAMANAFIASKVVSAVMIGVSGQFIKFDIISSRPDEIADYIMKETGRSVTSHISVGEYTGTERKVLSTICTPKESVQIKQFIAEKDPAAFATIMPVTTVWGRARGFADIREVENK